MGLVAFVRAVLLASRDALKEGLSFFLFHEHERVASELFLFVLSSDEISKK